MKRLIYSLNFILVIIVFGLYVLHLLSSCAQTGSISGGPRDSIAPVLYRSVPDSNSLNFQDDRIVLLFDEYLTLKEVEQQLVVSPPFDKTPKVILKGKKVVVDFEEPLLDSITYTLNFKNSITDFTEGNAIENFVFSFSTGSTLDTFKIKGRVLDAYTQKPREKVWVMLYAENVDSLPYKELPLYLAKTDTGGYYAFHNIKQMQYKIFALNASNLNYLYDLPNEEIGFADSMLFPTIRVVTQTDTLKEGTVLIDPDFPEVTDTLRADSLVVFERKEYYPDSFVVNLFREDKLPQNVAQTLRKKPYLAELAFTKPLKKELKVSVLSDFDKEKLIWDWNLTKDTALIWITDTLVAQLDSINLRIEYQKRDSLDQFYTQIDTVTFEYGFKSKKTGKRQKKGEPVEKNRSFTYDSLKLTLDSQPNIFLKDSFVVRTNHLIKSTDHSKIKLWQLVDTTVRDTRSQKLTATRITENTIVVRASRAIEAPVKLLNFSEKKDSLVHATFDFSANRNELKIQLTDSAIYQTDTLKLLFLHQNNYFFNQQQELKDSLRLAVVRPILHSAKWYAPNKIRLIFNDNFANMPIVVVRNKRDTIAGKIEQQADNQFVFVANLPIDTNAALKLEYKLLDWSNHEFSDNVELFFEPENQEVTQLAWLTADTVLVSLAFWPENITVSQLANNRKQKLNALTQQNTLKLVPDKAKNQNDTLLMVFEMPALDSLNNVITKTDTLPLKIDAAAPEKVRAAEQQIKVPMPLDFVMHKDTVLLRKYAISFQRNYKKSYRIKFYEGSFTDIYNQPIDSMSYNFTVADTTDYATVSAKIQLTDSTQNIENAILQLVIPNEEKIDNFDVQESIPIKLPFYREIKFIKPAKLELRLFIDQNQNGVWDTGEYLQHKQPEPVFVYPGELTIKANWTTELNWTINEP